MFGSSFLPSSSSSMQSQNNHKLAIWDIDDTVLSLLLGELKNHPILIPILLYITHSPFLMSAICTNRRSRDEKPIEDDLSVNDLLQLLKTFGIQFHPSLVLTLGDVREGLELLQREYGEHAKKQASQGLTSEPPVNIIGKNFQINRLHNTANGLFQTIISPQSIYLIDDNQRIIEDCLKAQYRGISATDPGDLAAASDIHYLIELASSIGLSEYLISLMTHSERHTQDPTLRKVAAILYGMNTGHLSPSTSPLFLEILFEGDEIGPNVISVIDQFKLYCEAHTSDIIKTKIQMAAASEKTKQRQLDFLAAEGSRPLRDAVVDHLQILTTVWLPPFMKIPRTSSTPSAWIPSSIARVNSVPSGILANTHRRPRSTALLLSEANETMSLSDSVSVLTISEDLPPSITWAYGSVMPLNNANVPTSDHDPFNEPKKSPRYD